MVLAVTNGNGSCTTHQGAQSRAVRIVSVNVCVSSETETKMLNPLSYIIHPHVTSDPNSLLLIFLLKQFSLENLIASKRGHPNIKNILGE